MLESLDFFPGPGVPGVVASVFCAFAAAATVAAAVAPALVVALALGSGCGALFCAAVPFAGAAGAAVLGSGFAVAAAAAFGVCAAGVEGLPLFAVALEDDVPEDEAPDVAAFDDGALLPFTVSAPEEFVPLVFAAGCCGPVVVLVAELELLPLLSPFVLVSPLPPWLVLPAELLDGAGVCCGAGGGLGGTLAGPDTPASSKAANGCELMFWLCAAACAGDAEVSETAAEALDILGTLGTLELREATLVAATLVMGLLATPGPPPLAL